MQTKRSKGAAPQPQDPTGSTYAGLGDAYRYFNERLFGGELPPCLITMQRKAKAYGYFAGGRFGSRDGDNVTDEIALNPTHFRQRSDAETLSTLAHEMAHLWQHHFGKASRAAYHNRQWAEKMLEIGLTPSDTGLPGGKQTGQRVSHYITPDGPFARACQAWLGNGHALRYVELWGESEVKKKRAAASKTKYSCGSCGLNAWGKPAIHLLCGECDERMEPEECEDGA